MRAESSAPTRSTDERTVSFFRDERSALARRECAHADGRVELRLSPGSFVDARGDADEERRQRAASPQRDAKPENPVAGNAEFDPAEQSRRRDMHDDEKHGEEGSFRGSNPPGSSRSADKTPVIPMTQEDCGQHTG